MQILGTRARKCPKFVGMPSHNHWQRMRFINPPLPPQSPLIQSRGYWLDSVRCHPQSLYTITNITQSTWQLTRLLSGFQQNVSIPTVMATGYDPLKLYFVTYGMDVAQKLPPPLCRHFRWIAQILLLFRWGTASVVSFSCGTRLRMRISSLAGAVHNQPQNVSHVLLHTGLKRPFLRPPNQVGQRPDFNLRVIYALHMGHDRQVWLYQLRNDWIRAWIGDMSNIFIRDLNCCVILPWASWLVFV